jgi:hypothetical protein
MQGISLLEAGKEKEGERHFKSLMGKLPREGYLYDIARTFAEPGYDNYLAGRLGNEKEMAVRIKAYFYMGLYYRWAGSPVLANRYLTQVAEASLYGMFETELAIALLEKEENR